MWNLPNLLTLLRIALIPVFVSVFYMSSEFSNIAAAGIFAFAAITDWIDGYVARRMGLATPFGEFLDPVADKLIVAVELIMLVEVHETLLIAIPAMIIIGREIVISALREWMSKVGSPNTVAVSFLGKIKTWAQMIAVVVLLVAEPGETELVLLGYFAISVAAILTVWTMVGYLMQALPYLNDHSEK